MGTIYAAEALCYLNRLNEAIELLSPTNLEITDTNLKLPFSPYSSFNYDPVTNISYILSVNLAIVHIMKVREKKNFFFKLIIQDDLPQAQQYVNKALSIHHSTVALLLQVYLELRKGKY